MARDSITVRLDQDLIDTLDEEADDKSVSRSEYIRQILHERGEKDELREEADTLRERLQTREERIEELERQLSRRSEIEEKVDTLAERQEESKAPFFVKWYHWWRKRD